MSGDLMRRFQPWQLLAALFVVSLAATLLFGALVRFRPMPSALEADELEYYNLSTVLLDGHLELNVRRTLGFPVVLAAIRLLGGGFLTLQIVMAALYALSAPLLALVVRRVGADWWPALLSGLLLAIWPPAIFYGTSLYSETLGLPIFLAALALLPAAPDRRVWPAVVAGLVLAIATHVRPMYLLFTPGIVLIALCEWRRFLPALRVTALVAAGYCALILPWSAFATIHFGHPILVSSNGGETLGGGINPILLTEKGRSSATISGRRVWTGPGKWLPPQNTGYLSAAEQGLPYDRLDSLLRQRTLDWIGHHPRQAIYLELCKLGYMWGIWPLLQNGWRQVLFGDEPTLLMLIAGTILFVRRRELRGPLSRLWLLPLFVSGVALVSWGSWRFRMPGDAGLIGFLVSAGWQEMLRRRRAPGTPDRPGDASPAVPASPYPESAR